MAYFLIRGGRKLRGEIEVKGAKNSVLKMMAASLLFSNPLEIENVPLIEDVFRMGELLKELGVSIEIEGDNRKIVLKTKKIKSGALKKEIAERLRSSIVLIGPLLWRSKKVFFPHPGGCVIGRRPIDVFLDGWRAMGAKINFSKNGYEIISPKKLKGADYVFRVVSVTGTETLMMTAALAYGTTILRNAAMEPEIPALAKFLNQSGAKISGAGTPTIKIEGTDGKFLRAKNSFWVIPDRIEAGSFIILGAMLGEEIEVKKCEPEHLHSVLLALKDAGVRIDVGKDWVRIRRPEIIRSVNIKTREYPGFPTDLQAPFTVLMTQAVGQSMIFETVFDGRLNYIDELNRMGANIIPCDPHRILVCGPSSLRGREIESPDLRAGLAFVIAALVAKGESRIRNVYQIDRGYEKIEERLKMLGADIQRMEE